MSKSPIGVGVIGLGFMGRTHLQAYLAAERAGFPCRVAAVADPHAERRAGEMTTAGNLGSIATERLFDPASVRGYEEPGDLLRDPEVQLVSICTYTDSHVELALQALAAGKHVLVEKPVALRSRDVQRLADAARGAGTVCMPAMCMRFWPGWDWLRDRVADRSLGRVRSATFQRMGAGPNWAADFYRDPQRSGGAMYDLHIHDADFIYWAFGKPKSVVSTGSLMHQTTLYRYEEPGLHVVAEGAWDLTPSAGFRMRFVVSFEQATAEFDVSKSPTLTVHTRDAGSMTPALPSYAGYDGEVRHLVTVLAEGRRDIGATLDEAVAVTEMLEAEVRSMESGEAVRL